MAVSQLIKLISVLGVFSTSRSAESVSGELLNVDTNGYIVYCPCMGRFGNQADQFLGALAFAKATNRTLVLPPWVEYTARSHGAEMVPFSTYFKVAPLQEYHRVVTMEQFMKELAPVVWPVGQRKVFCYTERHGASSTNKCNAKEGNPFGPFWDWFEVDFDESVVFGPLYYETENTNMMQQWTSKYPPSDYPVWAFVGAPGAFPVLTEHTKLQKYVKWSDLYENKASEFITKNIGDGPFVGIHLRTGPDFARACEHVPSSPNMFAAKQCIGDRSQYGTTTMEMCFPSAKTVADQVKKEVQRIGAPTVFIATDHDDFKKEIQKAVGKKVKLVRQPEPALPMLDLAILGKSDHFIGNCVSTFSAFVVRERDSNNLTSSFWAFERKHKRREEL